MRVFEAAARLGSFKSAAEELHVTPTAVSHQIRALEDRLGVRLFERGPRSVHLTSRGATLSRAANSALHRIDTAVRELTLTSDVLTVTTTPSFAALWLVPRLAEFEEAHPGVSVHLRPDEAIVPLTHQNHVDLAIRYGGGRLDDVEGDSSLLVNETFGPYYHPNNLKELAIGKPGPDKPAGRNPKLARTTLIETHWKNRELPPIGWREWLRRYSPRVRAPHIRSFDSQLHALHAAMAGEGIVLCSDILAGSAVRNGWLKPFRSGSSIRGLSYRLVVAPGREASASVQLFRRWLRASLAP